MNLRMHGFRNGLRNGLRIGLRIPALTLAGLLLPSAQVNAQDLDAASVRRAVSEPGCEVPSVIVAEIAMGLDGWRYRAIYRPGLGEVEVVGLFADAIEPRSGAVVSAIWYQAPSSPLGAWTVEAMVDGTSAQAVAVLKQRFGITDFQNGLWEIDGMAEATEPLLAAKRGVLESDPLAEWLEPFAPSVRKTVLGALVGVGYPAFDASPELHATAVSDAMLSSLAQLFAGWITTNEAHPDAALVEALSVDWLSPPLRCRQRTEYGPWVAIGELCNCHTEGPVKSCMEFSIVVSGSVDITLPWPPPIGTKVHIDGNLTGTIAASICGWERHCTGQCKRSVTTFLEDCTEVESADQLAVMTLVHRAYRGPQVNPTCAENSCSQNPPAGMPDDTVDCGLGTTPVVVP